MKLIPIQEAFQKKFARQQAIKELVYDAAGHCVHIGALSPGCAHCFVPDLAYSNIYCGNACNLNCVYCHSNKKSAGIPAKGHLFTQAMLYKEQAKSRDFKPTAMSFSGGGEPLLYMDIISGYMKVLRDMEKRNGHKPWYYLYTNGVLAGPKVLARLKEMGFDEIRFHLGASNFSKAVYGNMKRAARYLKVVTVETPAWEPHRKELFAMLPLIEDIGVKHLNIGEIELNEFNYRGIAGVLPRGEFYQCYEPHLCDGGLVYDIIEEVIRRKYSYSVLDCNCFVKSMQRTPAKFTCRRISSGIGEKGRA
jgi:pyruvate formate-lyase activating enzyme-like uncharacterized protein